MLRRAAMIVIAASACTRGNPAFGDGSGSADGSEGSSSRSTGDPTGPTDPSDPSDASLTGSVDSNETSATSPLDTGDDAQDPTTTTDPDPTDPVTDSASTGTTMTCEVGKPPMFELQMFDANANPIEPLCGGLTQIQGPVVPGAQPNEMVMTVCENDTCECAEGDEITLRFVNLSPTPVDAIDDGDNACVSLAWSRPGDGDGCHISWLSMETQVVNADHPRFMAANVAMPDWSHVMPFATLGPSLELCEEGTCMADDPGFYSMMLGNYGPMAPGGEPTQAQFNPFTNGLAAYEVYAQFAQVQGDCLANIGWAAVAVE